jgi:hypothetical protein
LCVAAFLRIVYVRAAWENTTFHPSYEIDTPALFFGLGLVFLTFGSQMVSATENAPINTLETPRAVAWVWVCFSEAPSDRQPRWRHHRDGGSLKACLAQQSADCLLLPRSNTPALLAVSMSSAVPSRRYDDDNEAAYAHRTLRSRRRETARSPTAFPR